MKNTCSKNRVREHLPSSWSEFDSLLGQVFGATRPTVSRGAHAPASLWEDESAYHLELDLPGVAQADVEITLEKGILQIAADITELATKARDRKLGMDDMQGATCTVTNLGGIGGIGFTPIVNYPEVCILGMSRGQTELKLVDGKVVERLMLPLSLSYDHRVINGADAARFVATLCNLLADPFQLMTTV